MDCDRTKRLAALTKHNQEGGAVPGAVSQPDILTAKQLYFSTRISMDNVPSFVSFTGWCLRVVSQILEEISISGC